MRHFIRSAMLAAFLLVVLEQPLYALYVGDINANPNPIMEGESATLTIKADGTGLNFEWRISQGPGSLSSSTLPSVIYTAPDNISGTEITVNVTVKVTGRGGSETRTISLRIVAPTPTPTVTPTATPTLTPSPTPSPTPTKKPTRTPVPTPTKTMKPKKTPIPTPTPFPKPTATPTPVPPLPLARFWSKELKMPSQCQHDISFAQHQVIFANINYCAQKYHKIFWVTQDDKGINVYQQMNIKKETPVALTFRVRGERGGEKIRCGVGYNDSLESAAKTPLLTLRTEWEQVHIDLTTKDLSNVLGGFYCEMKATDNAGKTDILFFLENIQFEVKK